MRTFFPSGTDPSVRYVVMVSALATQEFLTPAQFLVLVFAHLLPTFLEDTRHTFNLQLLGAGV